MEIGENLLDGPQPTLLPVESDVVRRLELGGQPAEMIREHPASSLLWAELANDAWAYGEVVASYAYARVGYHRGLDALRRNGWKGFGPIPWEHEGNRGFLRCLNALGRAAEAFGETDEVERIRTFLAESSPTAVQVLSSKPAGGSDSQSSTSAGTPDAEEGPGSTSSSAAND